MEVVSIPKRALALAVSLALPAHLFAAGDFRLPSPKSPFGAELKGFKLMAAENAFVASQMERHGSAPALYRKCKQAQFGQTRDDACVAVAIVKNRIRSLTGGNWRLVQAIAFTENRLSNASPEVNTSVRSHADAKGLMQVTPLIWDYFVNSSYTNGIPRKDGHRILGPKPLPFYGSAPYGLNNSILVGNAYLLELQSKYCRNGNTADCRRLVAAAYNAGETAVNRAGRRVPNIRETRQYVVIFEEKYNSAS
jgi:hypothetical protein